MVKFGKKKFELSDEIPWELALGLALEDMEMIGRSVPHLLNGKWDEFVALGPSTDDVLTLAMNAAALLGMNNLGESRASRDTSSSTSRRSRPTSSGSTRSTSGKSSGARRRSASGG